MSNRIILFLGAMAGVLLVALVAGVTSIMMSRPVQAQSSGITGMRQITVVGHGEAQGTPDTARIEMGVETMADTTTAALEQNNQQVQAIIDRLTALGVAEEDIQTSNFNIHARYDDQGRDVTGYTVNNMVRVTIRNLDQTGRLLDEVVQVGANRIHGISFSVDDPDSLQAQARDEAIANAREKATRLAQESGANLGEVLVISENVGSSPPTPVFRGDFAMGEAESSVPVQSGQQTVNANVQITFELR
jgi:hypothetical protein